MTLMQSLAPQSLVSGTYTLTLCDGADCDDGQCLCVELHLHAPYPP